MSAGSGATVDRGGTAGATITAGQAVYKDSSDGNSYKLADSGADATDDLYGIALHAASDGQPLAVLTKGTLNAGATVTVGEIYVLSNTAGGIAPVADLLNPMRTVIIGVGATTATINVDILVSGVVRAA